MPFLSRKFRRILHGGDIQPDGCLRSSGLPVSSQRREHGQGKRAGEDQKAAACGRGSQRLEDLVHGFIAPLWIRLQAAFEDRVPARAQW